MNRTESLHQRAERIDGEVAKNLAAFSELDQLLAYEHCPARVLRQVESCKKCLLTGDCQLVNRASLGVLAALHAGWVLIPPEKTGGGE